MLFTDAINRFQLNLDVEDKVELHGQEIHFLFKNGDKITVNYFHPEGAKEIYQGIIDAWAAEMRDTGTPVSEE